MSAPHSSSEIRQVCWNRAIDTYATGHIFERRATLAGRKLRGLAFLAVGVPALIGALIVWQGTEGEALQKLIPWAGFLGVVQVGVSAWGLIENWFDQLSYAHESAADNHRLSREYAKLGKTNPDDLETRFEILEAENRFREQADYKQDVSEEEKRRGMRAGLRKFQRSCSSCGDIPESLEASDCSVCGQF